MSLSEVYDVAGLELAMVLRQLRAELNQGLADAEGERVRFELGPVELSLTVTLSREAAPAGKIRFWVVEAGADTKISRESVHDLKLVLNPLDMKAPPGPDGKAGSVLITGEEAEGER
jgi:hypothetical protein